MTKIKIGNRVLTQSSPPYFIADIGANHDGDLQRAFKLIELAKGSGAHAAKFQNFKANTIVSQEGFNNLNVSHQKNWKKSVFEVYEDASIPDDWTHKLKEKCEEYEIDYFTSPYDIQSVDLVDPFVDVYKIGSGDITWTEILHYIGQKGKPVLLATGASTFEDVERAMKVLESKNSNIVLMQCNTNYTGLDSNFNYVNLNVLDTFKNKFPNVILGLSDHTSGHATVLGAIAKGAVFIEKHFTDDNEREGPDHSFAMNPTTWREMVDRSNELWRALGDGVKRVEENEIETVSLQRRGLRYIRDMHQGEEIKASDLIAVRPIDKNGIEPYNIHKVIGKKIQRDKSRDFSVNYSDFGE
jgi:sialic acid synthase SpsE